MGAEDEFVGGLDEVFLQLLELDFLLGPVPGAGGGVDRVDVFVVFDEGVDRLGRELEGHFVLRDHVDVHDVGFDVYQLVVEERFDQRVFVFPQFRVGRFGQHDRTERPDGCGRREGLGQTSVMLRHTVQWSFDSIDPLERGCQPGIDLGVEHDIGRRSRRKGCCRLGEQDLGHCDGVSWLLYVDLYATWGGG